MVKEKEDSGSRKSSEVLANVLPSTSTHGFIAGSWIICDDCADDDEVCVVPSCCFDALAIKDTTGTLDHDPIPRARLIAAAPDLLAALKGVVAVADRKTVEFDAARAAILKAEGTEMNKLLPTVWVMRTKDGFYPIHPSEKCKPEDHGRLNGHVTQIEDANGRVLWQRR